jgi:RND superfamily putative drug exporter
VLLPLKAVVVNFLSISASYGALVWIFQDGHLSGPLDFTPGPINTTTPIIMFCILFGLSMDYEVMLLSRIKEEYEKTGDNRLSVAVGIERTGRLITGAALIMVTVFFSFGLAEAVVIKAIGLGMGLAVLVDATIVRALLVPATMRLMGRWNWWAPKLLARLHRRLGLSETAIDEPDPAASPPYETAPPTQRR